MRCCPFCNLPDLEQVSIIRTHIPLLRLLKLRQAQIRTRLIPIPVLHQHTNSIHTTSSRTQTRKANANAIAVVVIMRLWCILGQESIRGDDPANIAKANLPRRPDCSAMVAAEVEIEPADYHRQGRVRAHRD